MAITNVITFRGGSHEVVVDLQVDLDRGVIKGEARGVPIAAEAPDVASLRAALDRLVAEHFAALPKTVPRRPADTEPPAPQVSPEVAGVVARMTGAAPRSEASARCFSVLLPGARDLLTPPPRWGSWRMPPDPNALDAVVDTLAKKGKLKAGSCPFWRSRAAVVHAVDAADAEQRRYAAARENGAEKRVRFRALAASADRLENALAEHAAIFDREWSDLWDGWTAGVREGKRRNRIDGDALAVPGLRSRLDDALADARLVAKVSRVVGEAVANSEADTGKKAFIARMLDGFTEITGAPPGDGAIDFVDAAAEVAGLRIEGHKVRGRSWRATTRKILSEPYFVALRTPLDRD